MNAPRTLSLLLVLGALLTAGGCASPGITFHSSRCEASREGGRLKALVFISAFEARGLEGEQLIYQVRLFDVNRRGLSSQDGKYQTADGTVAATVSLVVLLSPQTFSDVRVSIPAQELGVPPNNVPIIAEIAVFKPTGERVAAAWCSVPSLRAEEIMPPLAMPAPIPYWFVRNRDPNRLPILLGAFTSLAEAEAAATQGSDPPRQVNSDEFLWFVPFYDQHAEQSAILVGPCASVEDAREIAALFQNTPSPATKGLIPGAPIEIQVGQWLKQQEVQQAPSVRPAPPEEDAAAEPVRQQEQ